MSKYWISQKPIYKRILDKTDIDELYEGKWSKKDVMKKSFTVGFAKSIGLSKAVQRRIGLYEWKQYKIFKKKILRRK